MNIYKVTLIASHNSAIPLYEEVFVVANSAGKASDMAEKYSDGRKWPNRFVRKTELVNDLNQAILMEGIEKK